MGKNEGRLRKLEEQAKLLGIEALLVDVNEDGSYIHKGTAYKSLDELRQKAGIRDGGVIIIDDM